MTCTTCTTRTDPIGGTLCAQGADVVVTQCAVDELKFMAVTHVRTCRDSDVRREPALSSRAGSTVATAA